MKSIISSIKFLTLFSLVTGLGFSATETAIDPIETIQPGMSVKLHGEVTRILDEDEFRLQDETGSVRIYIGWKNRVTVRTGDKITVKGFVDNDLVSFFRPEVYAHTLVLANGTQIELK